MTELRPGDLRSSSVIFMTDSLGRMHLFCEHEARMWTAVFVGQGVIIDKHDHRQRHDVSLFVSPEHGLMQIASTPGNLRLIDVIQCFAACEG